MTLTVGELIRALQGLPEDYALEKNNVGNLVFYDRHGYRYLGWVDLQTGEVKMFVY